MILLRRFGVVTPPCGGALFFHLPRAKDALTGYNLGCLALCRKPRQKQSRYCTPPFTQLLYPDLPGIVSITPWRVYGGYHVTASNSALDRED